MRGALPSPVLFKSASAVIVRLRETHFVAREAYLVKREARFADDARVADSARRARRAQDRRSGSALCLQDTRASSAKQVSDCQLATNFSETPLMQ
jgi:hypothetical protein